MSSAGLIYKYFGKEIIKNICKSEWNKELSEDELEHIYQKMYKNLILEVDAIDNGVDVAKETLYNINTNLSSRVGNLNSPWNAPKGSGYSQHAQFKKAMKLCEEQFIQQLYGLVIILLPARNIVLESYNDKDNFNACGMYVLIKQSCPWREHLYAIEEEKGEKGLIKYVFFEAASEGNYRIQAVSESGFTNRVSIHKDYRGLRGDSLNEAAGITDGVFIHAAGFIGAATSLESCVKMADASIKQWEEEKKAAAEAKDEKATNPE